MVLRFSNAARLLSVLALALLGGCATLTGAGLGRPAEPASHESGSYEIGKQHLAAGRIGLAVERFESAIRREPGSVEALNALAASYDRLGRYDLSARTYLRALIRDPESLQTLNNIGYSFLLQRKFDLALAYLRDARAQDSDDPMVAANLRAARIAYWAATPAQAATAPEQGRGAPSPPTAKTVSHWLERRHAKVQKLTTRPRRALASMSSDAGFSPRLAVHGIALQRGDDRLPNPISAPLRTPDPGPAGRRRSPTKSDPALLPDPISAPLGTNSVISKDAERKRSNADQS